MTTWLGVAAVVFVLVFCFTPLGDAVLERAFYGRRRQPRASVQKTPEARVLCEEVTRLRAWLRLIEATTDHDNAYYALHGYDAPSTPRIARERVHPVGTHPSEMVAVPLDPAEPEGDQVVVERPAEGADGD